MNIKQTKAVQYNVVMKNETISEVTASAAKVSANSLLQAPKENKSGRNDKQNGPVKKDDDKTSTTNLHQQRDKIIQKYSESDNDISVSCSETEKSKSKLSKVRLKRDKCPCKTSDTISWKIKCTNCRQQWHTACANLRGVVSIVEIEDWKCPWCYTPTFASPNYTIRSDMMSIKLDSLYNQVDSLKLSELQDEISGLKTQLSLLAKTEQSVPHEEITKIHDDILRSIKFDLDQITSQKIELSLATELKAMKQSLFNIEAELPHHNTSPGVPHDTTAHVDRVDIHASAAMHIPPPPPQEPVIPYSHHAENFIDNSDLLSSLQSIADNSNADHVTDLKNRKVIYFGEFRYKYGDIEHSPSPFPAEVQRVVDLIL